MYEKNMCHLWLPKTAFFSQTAILYISLAIVAMAVYKLNICKDGIVWPIVSSICVGGICILYTASIEREETSVMNLLDGLIERGIALCAQHAGENALASTYMLGVFQACGGQINWREH